MKEIFSVIFVYSVDHAFILWTHSCNSHIRVIRDNLFMLTKTGQRFSRCPVCHLKHGYQSISSAA
jgi:hypothetical protein